MLIFSSSVYGAFYDFDSDWSDNWSQSTPSTAHSISNAASQLNVWAGLCCVAACAARNLLFQKIDQFKQLSRWNPIPDSFLLVKPLLVQIRLGVVDSSYPSTTFLSFCLSMFGSGAAGQIIKRESTSRPGCNSDWDFHGVKVRTLRSWRNRSPRNFPRGRRLSYPQAT